MKKLAEIKGLKSTRSLRLELNKPESKYISREVKVNGGYSYEILFSSLEPELQRILCRANVSGSERSPEVAKSKVNGNDSEVNDCFLWDKIQDEKLREAETKSTSLVPLNYKLPMVTDKAKLTRNHRINIVKAALEKRKEYTTIKEADSEFLDLMFMYHSFKTVDIIMRGFCAMIPRLKLSYLIDVSDNCIGDFYRIFRNLIYERQVNELLNYYNKSPQPYRYRRFFEKYPYFYTYENKIFIIQKPLRAEKEMF